MDKFKDSRFRSRYIRFMKSADPYYLHVLNESLSSRQRKNPAYSLRAFAKDLQIDSSNLSAVLRKKRNLPHSRAQSMAKRLKLSPKEYALFVLSSTRKKMNLDAIKVQQDTKKYLLDEKYYKIIAEWEYYAFLQLLQTHDFNPDHAWIASRLGLSLSRTDLVIKNLIDIGFVERDARDNYRRVTPSLETSEDVESQALQKSHVDALNIAKLKLETVPVELRDFSSVTMAIGVEKIPEAKAIIREFQEKLHALLTDGKKTEVYQFSCQLFPLTKGND